MSPELPPWLRAAIDRELEGLSGKSLAASSEHVTAQYRQGKPSRAAITGREDAAAYIAARLPATYAAVSAALHHALLRLPRFEPRSLTDVGAGPGTASIAATAQFASLDEVTLIDNNPFFLAFAPRLLADAPLRYLAAATIIDQDIARLDTAPVASDIVIAAYAMVELAPSRIDALIRSLWRSTCQLLLIVEPGTPAGFRTILAARNALIAEGAAIAAPCPGNGPCPLDPSLGLAPGDWCHFAQRLPRTRAHMATKSVAVPFEDEKFIYLAATRLDVGPGERRILAPPIETKAGIAFKLCGEAGLERLSIASRDKPAFKGARRLRWGDVL